MKKSDRPESMKSYFDLVRKQGLTPLTKVPGFTSLIAAVVGSEIKGSWWGHPAGREIYRIASELDDSEDVLVIKLLDGKQTFVDSALFPALFRVVCDRTWRAARRAAGEDYFLLRSFQVHTSTGNHRTVREPWSKWASPWVVAAADRMSFESASDLLRRAGRGRLTLPGL